MKKKILAICLATSMVFSLVGCGNKEELEESTPSKEVQESSVVEEVPEVNPKEYLPDAIEFAENSMLKITQSEEGIDMVAYIYSSEEESYFNMDVNGVIDFTLYEVGDDVYAKNDMTGIVDFLKDIADKTGEEFDESNLEDLGDLVKIGYTTKIDENTMDTEDISNEYVSTDEVNLLFDKYNKENVPEESIRVENGSIYFQYVVDGEEGEEVSKHNVSVVVDEETKKATDISIETEIVGIDNPTLMYVNAIPWNNEAVDLSWITKETECTENEVILSFASGLFLVVISSIDFDFIEESIPNEIEEETTIEEEFTVEDDLSASN